ncbi:hypothetical protein OG818_25995 [Streptomyces virginiae]|uniref:hypothetical protein n=1 Tax=Streptomyces virginiae TaxID=1961 RepID=UPI0022579B8C|nr:hypothetical protein [Streptomyces virginiae]MCX4719193.1 hypothetical protein [Streptomyces virginiae]
MRVVSTGAGGNAGTSVAKVLAADRMVTDVPGVARRRPGLHIPGVQCREADIGPGRSDLAELFTGADVVVHLAWKFQPTHDPSPHGAPTCWEASTSSSPTHGPQWSAGEGELG